MIPILVIVVLLVGVVLAVRLFLRRQAQQRAAHDARLRIMAQASLAAMRKKQAAQAAAAKETTPTPAPIRDERDCPFCAEPILTKARVCKHCGRDVEPVV